MPDGGPRKKKIGNIGARGQKDHPDEREQHEQRPAEVLAEAVQAARAAQQLNRGLILARPVRAMRTGRRARRRRPRPPGPGTRSRPDFNLPRTSNHQKSGSFRIEGLFPLLRPNNRLQIQRKKDLGIATRFDAGKLWRVDTNDRDRSRVDADAFADHRRIATEATGPIAVADNRNSFGGLLPVIRFDDRPADDRSPHRHPGRNCRSRARR